MSRSARSKHLFLRYFIASVWLVNGLFCKVLNWVPRHQEIVARILGAEYAENFVLWIGLAEISMAIWFASGIKNKLNGALQIFIVLLMNLLEMILAPDLLLWGPWNMIFAILFAGMIYVYSFVWSTPKINASI